MTLTVVPRSFPTAVRVLLCTENPVPLQELLAVPDASSPEIDIAQTLAVALERVIQRSVDVCVIDVAWNDSAVAELSAAIQAACAPTQILRLTEVEALSNTAGTPLETVQWPASGSLIRGLVRSAAQKAKLQAENRSLKRQLQARALNEIIGQSEAANRLREAVCKAADEEGCILIHGEPGAGTQHAARVVHLASHRATRPFLVLDCRVHSAESLERELLGEAAEGAGQEDREVGRLASCSGGSLLLKDVDTLPVAVQRRLAGVLARQAYICPVTGKTRPFDVRVMASTHVDLAALAQEGRFHVGLYGQLTTSSVHVPALCERVSDVGLLTEHILHRLAVVEGKPIKRLSVEALKVLRSHNWPGNIGELENVVERACSLDEGRLLTAEMVRPWIARALEVEPQEQSSFSLREMERKLIETTFARCQGNREQTARLLKIGIRTLSGKLREYGYPPRGGPGSNRELSKAA